MQANKSITVFVGLSGGVDSSVAALLLQQQGYKVEGLFMKNWEEDDTSEYCSAEQDLKDVRSICKKLKIPLHTINFSEQYWQNVFSDFLDNYKQGLTPNPDILCNREIKFKEFLNHAKSLGADYIATGHYAKVNRNNNKLSLLKGIDSNKDQSYFLYTLNQDNLKHSLFPLGGLQKSQVRQLAKEHSLITCNKKDSTGICFIGPKKFKEFLSEYLQHAPGPMQTPAGKTIGQHDGLMYYTLGQRSGLKIGGQAGMPEDKWYVIGKDLSSNTLIVDQGFDHAWHFSSKLIATNCHWIDELPQECVIKAKVRYRQPDQVCKIIQSNPDTNSITVEFELPQRSVTPGQSIVFYQNDTCLGGAIIHSTNSAGGIRQRTFKD